MNDQSGIRIISSSPLETKKLGELLGQTIRQGVVIGLMGELGAGKTTFTQGLARGLGVQARITSPTFTLINEYTVPTAQARGLGPPLAPQATDKVRLFHVDSYRLENGDLAGQVYGLGMDEIFDAVEDETIPHVVVIEWADRLVDLLPADRLMIRFSSGADRRQGNERTRRTLPQRTLLPDERMLIFCATGAHSGALLSTLAERAPGVDASTGETSANGVG